MRFTTTIAETRAHLDRIRADGRRVGFVPTMGYLHEGHASLIRTARAENDVVVVSIFVNPLQFGAGEDLEAYPRDFDRDSKICETEGTDVIFHPTAEEMVGDKPSVTVAVGEIGSRLCGRTRPGHFDGVATVVAKLWNIVGPSRSYFGRKDAQQLVVLRRMAGALNFPVDVVGCPIVRESDGLALSSRNVYLEEHERTAALALSAALGDAAESIGQGETDARRIAQQMAARISSEPLARLDYAVAVDPETLDEIERIEAETLLAVAAWVGKARLIDNQTVTGP